MTPPFAIKVYKFKAQTKGKAPIRGEKYNKRNIVKIFAFKIVSKTVLQGGLEERT